MPGRLNLWLVLIKYYSITHGPAIEAKASTPLLVGADRNIYLGHDKDSCVLDNTHNNISHLNPVINEITGIYWVAKNVSSFKFIGFCHYRRWFKHIGDVKQNLRLEKWLSLGSKRIVLVEPYVMEFNLIEHFDYRHIPGKFDVVLNILSEYDKEYYNKGSNYFLGNKLYPFNMMILKTNDLNDYVNWLYPLIELLIEKCEINSTDRYQKRLLGFATERLTGYYFISREYKIREVKAEGHGIRHSIGIYLNRTISNISFKLKEIIGNKRFNK